MNPAADGRFEEWATDRGDRLRHLDVHRDVPVSYAVDSPEQVGIDRVLNALAAHCLAHPHPAVVISVGTAVTIDLVDAKGVFQGGVIFPGPRLMARSLNEHTAKLPLVDAEVLPPVVAPGKNTEDSILAGIRDRGRRCRRPPGEPLRGSSGTSLGLHHRRRGGRPRPLPLRKAIQGNSFRADSHPRRHPHRRGGAAVMRVAVLTPAGTGAIATVEVSGPRAWELARALFRPAGKPLPAEPEQCSVLVRHAGWRMRSSWR